MPSDDPRLAAEGEIALARLALDSGDLSHAANHVAGALGCDPTLPDAYETLSELTRRTTDPVALFSLDGHVYIGTVVARAHVLAATNQPAEALGLLVSATAHAPDRPWATVPWVTAPELPGRIGPTLLGGILMRLAQALPPPADEVPPALAPYARLAVHTARTYPDTAGVLGPASAVGRRLGLREEAIAWARRACDLEPLLLNFVWLGSAYRDAGRPDDAIAAWEEGIAIDPDNVALHTDIAELLADTGRVEEALRRIDVALAIDPQDVSALPTACALRFEHDGDLRHLVALADHLREHPDNGHADRMLAGACSGLSWLGGVVPAGESLINMLRQVLEKEPPPDLTGASVSVSDLEPPSAVWTFHQVARDAQVSVQQISEPDIRRPRWAEGRTLWHFDGILPTPAVPPPSAAAAAALTEVAQVRWPHPLAAYDAAVRLSGLPLDDLIGLLVHPPQPPDNELGRALTRYEPGLWMRAVQVWACLGLLHHRADEPWPESARRRELVAIAYGQEDWTAEAALFALVVAAWVDPALRADVPMLLISRLQDAVEVQRSRPVTVYPSFAHLVLGTPGMPEQGYGVARQLLAEEED